MHRAQPYGPGLRSTEIGRCGPPKGGLLLALAQRTFQQNWREADKTNAARRGRRGRGSTTQWSRRWRGRSDGGRCWTLVCATLEDLARAKSVAPSYISRVLRLTLLAPDIVEAILRGGRWRTCSSMIC